MCLADKASIVPLMHVRRIAHLITLYVKINTDPKAGSVNTFSYIAIIVQPEPLNVQD